MRTEKQPLHLFLIAACIFLWNSFAGASSFRKFSTPDVLIQAQTIDGIGINRLPVVMQFRFLIQDQLTCEWGCVGSPPKRWRKGSRVEELILSRQQDELEIHLPKQNFVLDFKNEMRDFKVEIKPQLVWEDLCEDQDATTQDSLQIFENEFQALKFCPSFVLYQDGEVMAPEADMNCTIPWTKNDLEAKISDLKLSSCNKEDSKN